MMLTFSVTRLLHVALTVFFWGFWGVMLKFVVDAREDDVVGVTRLLHVAITGFLGVLGCVMPKFVVDAREDDVVGVTRLLHVALQAGFFGGSGV